jgi:hypothetical protein
VIAAQSSDVTSVEAADVGSAEAADVGSAKAADAATTKATDVTSAKATDMAAAEATDMAAAEAAHVAAAKAATVSTATAAAAAGFCTGGNKAAGKQCACQNQYQSSSHDILHWDGRTCRHRIRCRHVLAGQSRRRDDLEMGILVCRLY